MTPTISTIRTTAREASTVVGGAGRQPGKRSLIMRPWSDTIDPATIPDAVIASENARRNAAKRTTFAGGRPPKPRCHCGAYTLDAAKKRGHVCEPPSS